MITKIIEVTNNNLNWGKFLLGRMAEEWDREVLIEDLPPNSSRPSLLRACGWSRQHLWVLDLQTGEGACLFPGGHAASDLNDHRIWVCPMFEPFLKWLYQQDLSNLALLPDTLNLPDAEFSLSGYRRKGPPAPSRL